jgi:4-amino-4-deoxy-L-arabinose transferase-like glycosyltransferase
MSAPWMEASLAAVLASSFALVRLSRPGGRVDAILLFWLCFTAHVVVIAEVLSYFGALGRPWAWCAGAIAALCPSLVTAALSRTARALVLAPLAPLPFPAWRAEWRALSRLHRILLGFLALAASIAASLNLACALLVAPQNWDALTYHLARVAYYLEHGNLDPYPANYWAQLVHPHNGTALLLYTFLVSGRRENLFQLVQFVAYLVSIVAAYGIARRIGTRRPASLFAALIFALLTDVQMEASTAQNDLVCAAYVGVSLYFLLSYRGRPEPRRLLFAGVALGLGLGVKASVLSAIPSIAVVAVFAIGAGEPSARELFSKRVPALVASFALGALAFALPAGYADNERIYHHPVGPLGVRRVHSYEGAPTGQILVEGSKNLLRYGIELVSLDGLPPLPATIRAQHTLRQPVDQLLRVTGVHLEEPMPPPSRAGRRRRRRGASIRDFDIGRRPIAHENHSYWGVFGFALVVPAVAAALLGLIKARRARVIALAALVFLVEQAFYGPYDHWRGRYFVMGAVMAAPLVACCFAPRRDWMLSSYLALVVLIGGVSGVTAVVFRYDRAIIAVPALTHTATSVLRLRRLDQMLLNRGSPSDALRRFDRLVPARAVVGAALPPDTPEYVLFGYGLPRRIEPVDPKRMNLPPGASYLVFSESLLRHAPGDKRLGSGWFLRPIAP